MGFFYANNMARIVLDIPAVLKFSIQLKIRVSDLNYGNHLSNDVYLAMMHEARMQYFESMNYSEMNLAGAAVIMGDSAIIYKSECFYGDEINIAIGAENVGEKSFDLYYRFTKNENNILVAEAKTGMVCYDYNLRKTVAVPDDFKRKVGELA